MIYLELNDEQATAAEGILRTTGASEVNHKGTITEKEH
jgi:hypothetical protein